MKGLKEKSKEKEVNNEEETSKKEKNNEVESSKEEKKVTDKKETTQEKKGKKKMKESKEKKEKDNKENKDSKEKKNKNNIENKGGKENKDNKNESKFKKVEDNPKKVKNAVDKMIEYRKRKILIPIAILSVIIIIALFCSTIFALININNKNILSGISIGGIDVSGLSKEEAKAKIEAVYQEKQQKEIGIKYEEYVNTLNPTLLEVKYDIDKAVDEAYNVGKKDNIFINNYEILFNLIRKNNISVDMTLNEDIAKQTINDIGVNLPGIVIESSHAIEDNELIITKGQSGIIIDTDELMNRVKEKLNDINSNEDDIEIPVQHKDPDEINIDKIHEEVYKEAQDAYYVAEPFAIYPEVEGIDFDVAAAKEILKEDKEEYVIPLIITKPKVTLSQIGAEAFPSQLSTFTTRYDVSDRNRSTNLEIACNKLNGKVILSGETFSYNQTLGPRTVAAGYRTGKVYSAGQVVDGIGGGICQISSTLYNAVLMANLEIVERKNHQFVTGYLPAGRDATVSYGVIDFKFKNTRQYPVRLVASAKNGIATVSVYGIPQENEYTFSFTTKTIASIPCTTKYEEDPNLSAGTEQVKQKGVNGLKVETYITRMLNGKVISTTLLSRDTYDAMTRIVVKGTGPATATSTDNVNNANDTNNTNNQSVTQENNKQNETQKPEETPKTDKEDKNNNTTNTNNKNDKANV